MKKKTKKFDIVTMLLLIAILAVSAAIVYMLVPYIKSRMTYYDIQKTYAAGMSFSMDDIGLVGGNASGNADGENASGIKGMHRNIDFEALKGINPDCDSWIYACGGKINYPVVKASDDAFYLKHGLDGNSLFSGTIFIRSDIKKPYGQFDTAIYGHNMKDGSMFHELVSYKDEAYYKANPYVCIFLPDRDDVYEIFAVDVMNESELPVITEETEEAKEVFLKRVIGSSVYDCGVAAKPDDVIIELVTCEYSGSNSRIAVYAKKIS